LEILAKFFSFASLWTWEKKTRIKTQKKNENNITKQELSSVSEGFVALALASESFILFYFIFFWGGGYEML